MFADLLRRVTPSRAQRAQVPQGPGVRVRRLDPDTWLVEQGRRRRYKRLGGPGVRAGLLFDERRTRKHFPDVQRQLAGFLADEHVSFVLRELGINCVVDVGANTGQFARRLRRSGYQGRIASFEPVREFAEQLRANSADDPDWLVYPCALGEEHTTAEINATPGKRLSSMLPATEFGKGFSEQLREPELEEIEIRRLDSLFDEITKDLPDPRVYLKLDTQGFDLPAFRGAGDRIEEVLAMQSEVACVPIYDGMPRLPEQLREYESRGFEVSGMYPVSRHAATLRVIEFDMVLVRAAAVEAYRTATSKGATT